MTGKRKDSQLIGSYEVSPGALLQLHNQSREARLVKVQDGEHTLVSCTIPSGTKFEYRIPEAGITESLKVILDDADDSTDHDQHEDSADIMSSD